MLILPAFVLALLPASTRPEAIPVYRFDLIEINRVFNEWGNERFTQLIGWRFVDGRLAVDYYLMVNNAYDKEDKCHKERWDKWVKEEAAKIKDWERLRDFERAFAFYAGRFTGGTFLPKRRWNPKRWEITLPVSPIAIISAPAATLSTTQYDREVEDRKSYHHSRRRGLDPFSESEREKAIDNPMGIFYPLFQ